MPFVQNIQRPIHFKSSRCWRYRPRFFSCVTLTFVQNVQRPKIHFRSSDCWRYQPPSTTDCRWMSYCKYFWMLLYNNRLVLCHALWSILKVCLNPRMKHLLLKESVLTTTLMTFAAMRYARIHPQAISAEPKLVHTSSAVCQISSWGACRFEYIFRSALWRFDIIGKLQDQDCCCVASV